MAYQPKLLSRLIESRLTSCPQLSLRELALELHVDRHTLQRALRNTRGVIFRELKTHGLARRAATILWTTPDRSIKEIAFSLGFKSTRSFSRFVKQELGATPTAIRLKVDAPRLPPR